MPLVAFALVVAAAFSHATWNLLAKRATGCHHFNWYFAVGAVILWLPLAIWASADLPRPVTIAMVGALIATSVLHALYAASLMRGYRTSDLSIVYPVARGAGPLLSFVGAIAVLHERPSLVAAAGALSIAAGIVVVAGGRRLWRGLRAGGRAAAGLRWGVTTGCLIAAYTLNDGWAVKVLLISPILIDWSSNVFRAVVFAPLAWLDRARVRDEYPRYWKPALGVSILGPFGYILVLHAMKLAPVSHVAPARELSMLVGAWFGARVLGEGDLRQRMVAAVLIVAGVAALALG